MNAIRAGRFSMTRLGMQVVDLCVEPRLPGRDKMIFVDMETRELADLIYVARRRLHEENEQRISRGEQPLMVP